jgi:DNA-binding IclR family transcriptional regulator
VTKLPPSRNRGVQAIETGATLLAALSQSTMPLTLTQVSLAADMPTGKAYRYLVSLCRAGLIAQDRRTGTYDFGPLAAEIGHTVLERFDRGRATQRRLHDLCKLINQTVCVFQWTAEGPVVTHLEQCAHHITIASRLGLALPLFTTATGRIFAAFGEGPELRKRIRAEIRSLRKRDIRSLLRTDPQTLLAEIRQRGLARIRGEFRSGSYAIAAPILDGERRLRAVVSAIGERDLDVNWNSLTATHLRSFAAVSSTDL